MLRPGQGVDLVQRRLSLRLGPVQGGQGQSYGQSSFMWNRQNGRQTLLKTLCRGIISILSEVFLLTHLTTVLLGTKI